MTAFDKHRAALVEECGGEPNTWDILDYIASYSDGWPAEMASIAYINEIKQASLNG